MRKILIIFFTSLLIFSLGCKKDSSKEISKNFEVAANEPTGVNNIAYKWG